MSQDENTQAFLRPDSAAPAVTGNSQSGQDNTQVNIGQTNNSTIIGKLVKQITVSPDILLRPLILMLSVVGVIAFANWWTSRPAVMTGDFNIAVAEFVQISEGPAIAPIVSRNLFNFLDNEYRTSDFDLNVQIAHDKIGPVSSAAAARELAETIHADVVIYGTVSVLNDLVSISPSFYVSNTFNAEVDEFAGQYGLAEPVDVPLEDVAKFDGQSNTELRQKSTILVEFTKGLIYISAEDYDRAQQSVERALAEVALHGDFEGAEVLYMLGSNAALRQPEPNLEAAQSFADEALRLNPDYARAYIARANIYYVKLDFEQALEFYQKAAQAADTSFGAYIAEKANLGTGNIYAYQYQVATAPDERAEYARNAHFHFDLVIDSYNQSSNDALNELAASAYYGKGIIYQLENEPQQAAAMFELTLSLSQYSDQRERAERRLEQVR